MGLEVRTVVTRALQLSPLIAIAAACTASSVPPNHGLVQYTPTPTLGDTPTPMTPTETVTPQPTPKTIEMLQDPNYPVDYTSPETQKTINLVKQHFTGMPDWQARLINQTIVQVGPNTQEPSSLVLRVNDDLISPRDIVRVLSVPQAPGTVSGQFPDYSKIGPDGKVGTKTVYFATQRDLEMAQKIDKGGIQTYLVQKADGWHIVYYESVPDPSNPSYQKMKPVSELDASTGRATPITVAAGDNSLLVAYDTGPGMILTDVKFNIIAPDTPTPTPLPSAMATDKSTPTATVTSTPVENILGTQSMPESANGKYQVVQNPDNKYVDREYQMWPILDQSGKQISTDYTPFVIFKSARYQGNNLLVTVNFYDKQTDTFYHDKVIVFPNGKGKGLFHGIGFEGVTAEQLPKGIILVIVFQEKPQFDILDSSSTQPAMASGDRLGFAVWKQSIIEH